MQRWTANLFQTGLQVADNYRFAQALRICCFPQQFFLRSGSAFSNVFVVISFLFFLHIQQI